MAVPNNHPLSAEHRRHDRLLVARFAVGDAGYGQEHEARELVRRCSECAALAADISAISNSIARLPAPSRQRDFRLTPEQAANLRGSRFDRWLRSITGSGWATVRPVAAVALSVGLVMSVVGFVPMLGAAAPSADTFYGPVAAPQPTPEQTSDNGSGPGTDLPSPGVAVVPPEMGSMTTPAADNIDNAYLPQPTPAVEPPPGETTEFQKALPGPGTALPDLLLLIGLSVTILAVVVLALLYVARRRYYDPLLR